MGASKRASSLRSMFLDNCKAFLLFLILFFVLTGCSVFDTLTPTLVQASPRSPTVPSETSAPSLSMTSTPTISPTAPPTTFLTPTAESRFTLRLDEPHPGNSYSIPLTTQWVSETSAMFHFALQERSSGYLFYWPVSQGIPEYEYVPISEESLVNVITIRNLVKGSSYYAAVGLLDEDVYRVPNFLEGLWDPVQITTVDTERWPVRIAVIGDTGFGQQITFDLIELISSYEPSLVIHTGDIVYRVEENADPVEAFIAKYYTPFAPLLQRIPVYPVPGNHEYDDAALFERYPYYASAFPPLSDELPTVENGFRQYYALELGNLQILFLDTQIFWRNEGAEEQTSWLEARLRDEAFEYSIVVFHVPPFSSGLHADDGAVVLREWVPFFERYRVPLVLSGHDHNYQRISVNDVTYVVSGGGSSVLYSMTEPHPGNEFFAAISHFVFLTVYQNHLELEAISVDGEVIDAAVIEFED